MSALTDYFTALANKIRSKTGKIATLTPSDMVDEIDDVYTTGYNAGINSIQTQTKTASATPKTSTQTINPDSGKLLSSVTIPAAFGGDLSTYCTTVGTWTRNSGTAYADFTLTCEVDSWYFFAIACPDHVMSLHSISNVSKSTILQSSVTKTDGTVIDNYHGVIFQANNTQVLARVLRVGTTRCSSVSPVFFKLCDG